MADCAVDTVYAPNGEPSILFQRILDVSRTQDEALRLYLRVKDEPIPEDRQDKNGEATLESVVHRDDLGFKHHHRVATVHPSTEAATRKAATDGVLAQIEQAIDRLQDIRNAAETEAKAQQIGEDIQTLRQQKNELKKNKSAKEVEAIADNHKEMIEKVLSMPNISMAQMNFIGKLVRAWDWETVTNQYLNSKQKGGAMEETLREISDDFDKLRREVRNVEREIALDQVQKDYEGITIEEATELPEESWIMTQAGRAFDLSRLIKPR
jgi:ribosomal 50S subunit-associated protein YjgA (DUF615 family)